MTKEKSLSKCVRHVLTAGDGALILFFFLAMVPNLPLVEKVLPLSSPISAAFWFICGVLSAARCRNKQLGLSAYLMVFALLYVAFLTCTNIRADLFLMANRVIPIVGALLFAIAMSEKICQIGNIFVAVFAVLLVADFVCILLFPEGLYEAASGPGWILGYKNSRTPYFTLMIVFSAIRLYGNRKRSVAQFFGIGLLCLVDIYACDCMSGLLGLVVVFVLCALAWRIPQRISFIRWFPLFLALYMIVFICFVVDRDSNFISEFIAGIFSRSSTFTGRTSIWDLVIDGIVESHFLGIGVIKVSAFMTMTDGFTNAHNHILELLICGGLPMAVLYAFSYFLRFKDACFTRENLAIMAGVYGLLIVGLMSFISVYSPFMYYLLFSLCPEGEPLSFDTKSAKTSGRGKRGALKTSLGFRTMNVQETDNKKRDARKGERSSNRGVKKHDTNSQNREIKTPKFMRIKRVFARIQGVGFMTIEDLFILIRRNLAVFIVGIIVCAGVGAAYATLTPVAYNAKTVVIVSTGPKSTASFVSGYSAPDGVTVTSSFDSNTKMVTVTAKAGDSQTAIAISKDAADKMMEGTVAAYPDRTFLTTYADDAVIEKKGLLRYSVAGAMGGLFLGVLYIVALYLFKQPLLSSVSLERLIGAPCLYDSSRHGNPVTCSRLYLMLKKRFASSHPVLCLVTVGTSVSLDNSTRTLIKQASRDKEPSQMKMFIWSGREAMKGNAQSDYPEANASVLIIDKKSANAKMIKNALEDERIEQREVLGFLAM